MNNTEKILLSLVGRALFKADITLPYDTDWEALFKEARAQAVLPLVFDCLKADEKALMPKEIKDEWEKLSYYCLSFREQLAFEEKRIVKILKSKNIIPVILKGSSVAVYYPNPMLRAMGDIDILVSPDEQQRAVEILIADGYTKSKIKVKHHIALHKRSFTIEIHQMPNILFNIENKEISKKLYSYFEDAFIKAEEKEGLPMLSVKHQALVLLLHKISHFQEETLGLRQLCDWAVFVNEAFTYEARQEIYPMLKDLGLKFFADAMTAVTVKYLRLPLKTEATDDEVVDCVMEQIAASGNFGFKETYYGKNFFTDIDTDNRILAFVKKIVPSCKKHWQPCEKYPVLLIAAPFVVMGKYIKLCLMGKKKIFHPVKMYRHAAEKAEIKKKLRIFELGE